MVRVGRDTAVMSSPSRIITATDASSSNARAVVLRPGARLPAPVAQALHTRSGCRLQQRGLGVGIGSSGARDLGGLRRGELPGPERGLSLGQAFERTRGLECSTGGADRLARRLGD